MFSKRSNKFPEDGYSSMHNMCTFRNKNIFRQKLFIHRITSDVIATKWTTYGGCLRLENGEIEAIECKCILRNVSK